MIKKYFFKEISSTNDVAKELLVNDDLIVVSAECQTKGKGRNENKWIGNSGENIYCSFGIKHKLSISINQVIIYQAIGAIVSAQALRKATERAANFKIKYPNDVMAQMPDNSFGKICGVLAEHTFQGSICTESVIGIGVNINQTIFSGITANTPTSLKLLCNRDFSTNEILELMTDNFLNIYNLDYSKLFGIWNAELNFNNKRVKVKDRVGNYEICELLQEGKVKIKNLDSNKIEYIDNGDSIRYDL